MPAAVGLELSLDASTAAAGGILSGRVSGGAREVQLVRRERTPGARGSFHVAVTRPEDDGCFELDVPHDAPPTTERARCQLTYSLIAHRPGRRRSRAAVAEDVELTAGPVPATRLEAYPHDRVIASFDARGFHVELAQAELCGGGCLSGRVHTDRPEHPTEVLVGARLFECWRIDRGWNVRYQPIWREQVLWESDVVPTVWADGGTWAGFAFDLPAGLPPAVEGRVLAWRYEVEARRPMRFTPDRRAVVTPIGFQAA